MKASKHPKGIAFNHISFRLSYSSGQFVFRQHIWCAHERPSTKPISPSLKRAGVGLQLCRGLQMSWAQWNAKRDLLHHYHHLLSPLLLILLLLEHPHQREANEPLSSLTLERFSTPAMGTPTSSSGLINNLICP